MTHCNEYKNEAAGFLSVVVQECAMAIVLFSSVAISATIIDWVFEFTKYFGIHYDHGAVLLWSCVVLGVAFMVGLLMESGLDYFGDPFDN